MIRPGKMFGGILLALIGVNILLGMIGINIGGLMGMAIGACLLYWGYSKWQQKGGWSFPSVFLLIIGGLILMAGLGGIVSLIIGIALIYGGYRLIKSRSEYDDYDEFEKDDTNVKSTYDTIDEEFAKLMNEK